MNASLKLALEEHLGLFASLEALGEPVHRAAKVMSRALQGGGKVMLCGNGGSAADAQHLAAEFTGRFVKDRRPLAALALSTDTSALTCIANDYSFDDVFRRQVEGLGKPGDCLLAISTSGNSRNVVTAAEAARAMGITTVGLLGRDGGALVNVCDLPIVVPGRSTARIQEAHIFIGHVLCAQIEEAMGYA